MAKKSEIKTEIQEASDDIQKLLVEIKKLNGLNNDRKNVITKAVLTGFFTTIGATFGFTIFIFILSSLTTILGGIPIVSRYYENSAIKTIIDYQVSKIKQEEEKEGKGDATKQVEEEVIPTNDEESE